MHTCPQKKTAFWASNGLDNLMNLFNLIRYANISSTGNNYLP